jgi:thiamine-phosphate pyrophosphorylase
MQYRDKRASGGEIFRTTGELVKGLHPRGVHLIVNDRPDIAAVVRAGGVHLGQEDVPLEAARNLLPRATIGLSTHSLEEVRAAAATSADYIAVGPIFHTTTKSHVGPVVGVEFIFQARRLTKKPLVAIGGITLENVTAVWQAGADSVAVAGDILNAASPAARAREFLELARYAQK